MAKASTAGWSGTALLYRGVINVCPVRYAITIAHPSVWIPPVRGSGVHRPKTFVMQAVLRFESADVARTDELWGDRDLELKLDNGRRFACLLLKKATADGTMWECGLNPCS